MVGGFRLPKDFTVVRWDDERFKEETLRAVEGAVACAGRLPADGASLVVVNRNMPSKLQDGPTCGLVALSMVADARDSHSAAGDRVDVAQCHPDVDRLLALARSRGFTRHGEMFSARRLAELAEEHYSMDCRVLGGVGAGDIAREIGEGRILLMAYDADRNHSPCLLRGHKAHWAIVTGMVFSRSPLSKVTEASPSPSTGKQFAFEFVETGSDGKRTLGALTDEPLHPLFVLARQPKSRRVAAWDIDALVQSSRNIADAGPERPTAGEDAYVMEGPLSETLAGIALSFAV